MGGIYWIASYPKSGNTWFRAFLQNLRENPEQPVGINSLTTGSIASSREWVESVAQFDLSDLSHGEIDLLRPRVYEWTGQHSETGYHKIHDAYRILPDGEPLTSRNATRGVLCIVRNPLDVAPSLANHMGMSIDDAISLMANPQAALSGGTNRQHRQLRQIIGSWSSHVASWLDTPGLNVHQIRYEDMLSDAQRCFSEAAKFLELPHDPDRIDRALAFSHFDELSRQEAEEGFRERPWRATTFFREGRAGGWRDRLTEQQVSRIVEDHGAMMRRLGYLDEQGMPL